jgi:hypothetical protein
MSYPYSSFYLEAQWSKRKVAEHFPKPASTISMVDGDMLRVLIGEFEDDSTGEEARPTLWRGRSRPRWGVASDAPPVIAGHNSAGNLRGV